MKSKKHMETLNDFEYDFICEFIKTRYDLGLTQQEMADKSNVLRDKIAKVEAGIYSPNIRSLSKILEPLGYRIKLVKQDELNESRKIMINK